MMKYLNNISYLVLTLFSISLSAQQQAAFYYFDGEDVVFEFNAGAYQKAYKDLQGNDVTFSDLEVHEVLVSGDYNDWNKDGWEMKNVGPDIYQLRKKIKSFGRGFSWKFKFLVNKQYWAEPDKEHGLFVEPIDILDEVFGVEQDQMRIDKKGNARFFLEGHKDAKKVILTGTFVNWHEHKIEMNRVTNGWEIHLALPLGRYEYKFIVDGEWTHDTANENKIMNEHRTYNSILHLFKEVTFSLNGHDYANRVVLAGTFNDWNESDAIMEKTDTGWQLTFLLPSGKHFYKFIVDGEWIIDPDNPIYEADNAGNLNSILFVQ